MRVLLGVTELQSDRLTDYKRDYIGNGHVEVGMILGLGCLQ